MQKIRREVIDKMIAAQLSSLQVDMIVYLSRYQDETGNIQGIYYREACKDIGMSKQSFYDVLRSLEKKKLISLQKADHSDWDICILDNDCTGINNQTEKGQYVNTNQHIFYTASFRKLKANEKLLAMYLLRRCAENHGSIRMTISNFRKKYTELLQCTARALKGYLASLQTFFSIGDKDGYKHVRTRKAALEKDRTSEKARLYEHIVKAACRRSKIQNPDAQAVKDVAELWHKQYARDIKNYSQLRHRKLEVQEVLELAKGYIHPKKLQQKELQVPLVHKLLRGILGLEAMLPGGIVTE